MNNMQILLETEIELLRYIMKVKENDEEGILGLLKKQLVGNPLVSVYQNGESGEYVFSVWATMMGLYEYHKQNPDCHIDELVQKAFERIFSAKMSLCDIRNSFSCLLFHLVADKQNVATFQLDTSKLVDLIKQNVVDYHDYYSRYDITAEINSANGKIAQFGYSILPECGQ